MELIILYVIISYIMYMGMIVNEYDKYTHIPFGIKISYFFAPLIIPFIIGTALSNFLNSLNK